MKTFLKEKVEIFNEFREEVFALYPQAVLEEAIARLLVEIKGTKKIPHETITTTLMGVLSKTETFNVMSTLIELQQMVRHDSELLASMKDPSYNVHRTIAMSICGLYGSGAISLFGFVDCKFRFFFPTKRPKSFISKGIAAIVASATSVVISDKVKENYAARNLELLGTRGVKLDDLVDILDQLQRPYNPDMPRSLCEDHILAVLAKQQTFHTIQLAIKIDRAVENGELNRQYTHIVGQDEGLFGVDESIATAIPLMYGTIALTNFGYLDKVKPGIIQDLDSDHAEGKCNTFMDDIVCGIVAAACGRLAHNNVPKYSKPLQ
ncbi:Phosphatidylglycerophosphatase A [Paenibacillus sp. UNCCL117]|uniref:phosphatidylglycerophosphatase A family protein n=1 Tax=unclassified Paenibacillus TaxID=185978 RepID=UPI0008828AF2|nr:MULTISPECIES: phosphatidylglycerophosphatase A [unclassified Paenibacillus]SDD26235.1 Phosphatidylglycerophosphatase A [Paenibacillus sp. cl123]SFW41127.1 Phosphatidylglycerophosphatase A [Paenibacillus sp. UNCCL117]